MQSSLENKMLPLDNHRYKIQNGSLVAIYTPAVAPHIGMFIRMFIVKNDKLFQYQLNNFCTILYMSDIRKKT